VTWFSCQFFTTYRLVTWFTTYRLVTLFFCPFFILSRLDTEPRHQAISGEKLTGKRRNQTISGEKWTEKPLNQTKSCEKTISGEKSGRSNTTGEIIAVGGAITGDK
jgi:hypothetical protein